MTKGEATAAGSSLLRSHIQHGHMHSHIKVEFNTLQAGAVYRIIMVLRLTVTPCDSRLRDYVYNAEN